MYSPVSNDKANVRIVELINEKEASIIHSFIFYLDHAEIDDLALLLTAANDVEQESI
jgi:hypothetical protein